MARKSLDAWIESVLDDPDKSKPCSQITLAHITVLGNGHFVPKEIHTIRRMPEDASKPWDPNVLGPMFRTKAEVYCQDLPGQQTFLLTAKYGKDDGDAEHPFVITGEKNFQSLTSYPANEAGGKAMGQDLLMLIAARTFGMQQTLFEYSQKFMEMARTDAEAAKAENREMFVLLRDSAMREAELRNTQRLKILEYQRATEERRTILKLAPALINTLLGREVFPVGVQDTALIETIASKIPEDQIKMIQTFLPEPIGGLLFDRLTQALREERAARALDEQTAKMLPQGEGGIH